MSERAKILDELAALLAVPRDMTTPANLHGSFTFLGAGPSGQLPSPNSSELCRVHGDWRAARSWQVTLYPPNRYHDPVGGGRDERSADVEDSFALIQFASGGPPATVQIDWRQGGVYMFAAAQLSVTAVVPTLPLTVAGIPEPMTLQASIAPTTRANVLTPTMTVTYGDIAASTTVIRAIPPFARVAILARLDVIFSDQYVVEFRKFDGSTIVTRIVFTAAATRLLGDATAQMTIPSEATFVGIFNTSGVNAMMNAQIIYELAI